ncbi:unnamed protein product [Peniophora sp. CBMAI 1063]|nr:unnamed protein product [Peniophora sp. CBMAI 1063]
MPALHTFVQTPLRRRASPCRPGRATFRSEPLVGVADFILHFPLDPWTRIREAPLTQWGAELGVWAREVPRAASRRARNVGTAAGMSAHSHRGRGGALGARRAV